MELNWQLLPWQATVWQSKKPTNHFQMNMYLGNIILWTSPFTITLPFK